MRRVDPGLAAGRTDGVTAGSPGRVLAKNAGDQLAALVARAADAPTGLIHFVEGDRLRLYGGSGVSTSRDLIADAPVKDSFAEIALTTGAPVVIGDLSRDPRVPADSMVMTHLETGAYLGHPVHDSTGAVVGVCSAFDVVAREWSPGQVAAVAEAAQVSMLLIDEQWARQEVDRQRRFLDSVVDSLHDGVIACDAEGTVVLVNARMRKLWGGAPVPGDGDDGVVEGLY